MGKRKAIKKRQDKVGQKTPREIQYPSNLRVTVMMYKYNKVDNTNNAHKILSRHAIDKLFKSEDGKTP